MSKCCTCNECGCGRPKWCVQICHRRVGHPTNKLLRARALTTNKSQCISLYTTGHNILSIWTGLIYAAQLGTTSGRRNNPYVHGTIPHGQHKHSAGNDRSLCSYFMSTMRALRAHSSSNLRAPAEYSASIARAPREYPVIAMRAVCEHSAITLRPLCEQPMSTARTLC